MATAWACSPSEPLLPSGNAPGTATEAAQDAAAGSEFRLQSQAGGVPFQARLIRVVQDPARRDFDEQVWQARFPGHAGVLWLLQIQCGTQAEESAGSGGQAQSFLSLAGLQVSGQGVPAVLPGLPKGGATAAHEPFEESLEGAEDSAAPRVYHPLDVLLSAPPPSLAPGQSTSIVLFGPQTWSSPELHLGTQRFPLEGVPARAGQPLKDQPILAWKPTVGS